LEPPGNPGRFTADVPIEVTLRGQVESVVLTVHNKGQRIPKNHLHDIFDPFKQLPADGTRTKDERSVGLGLYIVQAIVTAHHGTIDVESGEQGTTFKVHLPRTVTKSSPEPKVKHHAAG
jgi:signal transduction histidine kinase